jgi:hypothetical protein
MKTREIMVWYKFNHYSPTDQINRKYELFLFMSKNTLKNSDINFSTEIEVFKFEDFKISLTKNLIKKILNANEDQLKEYKKFNNFLAIPETNKEKNNESTTSENISNEKINSVDLENTNEEKTKPIEEEKTKSVEDQSNEVNDENLFNDLNENQINRINDLFEIMQNIIFKNIIRSFNINSYNSNVIICKNYVNNEYYKHLGEIVNKFEVNFNFLIKLETKKDFKIFC